MVSRYAVLRLDVVENVVLCDEDGDWQPPEGSTLKRLTDGQPCAPGWTFEGDTFAEPETEPTVTTSAVTVDAEAFAAARKAVTKATTVAGIRAAVLGLFDVLTPTE